MVSKRGLVISCPIEIKGSTLLAKTTDLDPQELRHSLLFWDNLEFPASRAIYFGGGTDAKFLEQCGIIQRTVVPFKGETIDGRVYREAHVGVYRQLDEAEPGVWSLATGENSISFLDDELDEGRGALVRLHQAIPVPDKEVPLADILEFRTKRRDELLALREHLERAYQRVITAGDGQLAWNTEIDALQGAIVDHIKVSRESGLRLRLSGLSASLNLPRLAISAIAAQSLQLPLVASLLTAGAASISVSVGAALKRHEPSRTPFRYISSYQNELF